MDYYNFDLYKDSGFLVPLENKKTGVKRGGVFFEPQPTPATATLLACATKLYARWDAGMDIELDDPSLIEKADALEEANDLGEELVGEILKALYKERRIQPYMMC